MMVTPSAHWIRELLEQLYGISEAPDIYFRLLSRLDRFKGQHPDLFSQQTFVTERDVVLITYGDMVTRTRQMPLETLYEFLTGYLANTISTIHLLPFFPYSSDDGFSVIDYWQVNPSFGTWQDIEQLGKYFRLMFDAVINHISAKSRWFQEFLQGNKAYRDFFIVIEPDMDLSGVVRPRALPLLTRFKTGEGDQFVWTTFSEDQIDLDFSNSEVLLKIIDVLLYYMERGASIIRLDAIAYLWKEIGTSCIHLPQTHAVVRLFRAIVDTVAPSVLLLTETNVPHEENISYFGDGTDEAHLVYQFSLPPLVAHTLIIGSSEKLTEWAASLTNHSPQTAFFNFTASHDGIGIRPAVGILDEDEVNALVRQTLDHGGNVSYKTNADGTQSPYELNIVYYSLLNDPESVESPAIQINRFLCSQAIMLALAGVPGIYFHSLVGSINDAEGVAKQGHFRAINRKKLELEALLTELNDLNSVRYAVFSRYQHLIRCRIREKAFHPCGRQTVLRLSEYVFGLLRKSPDESETILAVHNISAMPQLIALPLQEIDGHSALVDVITSKVFPVDGAESLRLELAPHQVLWLKAEG